MNTIVLRNLTFFVILVIGIISSGHALADEFAFFKRIDDPVERWFCKYRLNGVLFQRTELFFGTNKPGGQVSDEEFQQFVDAEVTPRFPDGLTLLSGLGQFKNSAGVIEKERSKLLILLYTFNDELNRAVDKIRDRYKEIHQQQSVLRVDERSCVSF